MPWHSEHGRLQLGALSCPSPLPCLNLAQPSVDSAKLLRSGKLSKGSEIQKQDLDVSGKLAGLLLACLGVRVPCRKMCAGFTRLSPRKPHRRSVSGYGRLCLGFFGRASPFTAARTAQSCGRGGIRIRSSATCQSKPPLTSQCYLLGAVHPYHGGSRGNLSPRLATTTLTQF